MEFEVNLRKVAQMVRHTETSEAYTIGSTSPVLLTGAICHFSFTVELSAALSRWP